MNFAYCFHILVCLLPLASLRSIDQIIADVERDFEENNNEAEGRLPSKVWFDYQMQGRTEELVKLQLDLVLTKELWDTVIDTEDALPRRYKRNAVKDRARLWPWRIPYVINEEFDLEDRNKLLLAMDHWEEHTCLTFVEADKTKDYDVIEFVPVQFGCESLLGRMQGRQPINLAKACMYREVIVHEIGHALGLYHEHMRHDRDEYVTIHYQNVNTTYHRQFDKLKATQYNWHEKPYDYESIMHYGKLFYSLNRSAELVTIEPTDAAYLDVIGEAPSLSFYDAKIVNDMYNCSGVCYKRTCPVDSFLGKNCQCYCKGETAYDIVLCDTAGKCAKPNINLDHYNVFTNNYENEIKSWDIDAYPDGTTFFMQHMNESCGLLSSTLNCTDGEWTGEVPPCERACIVEDFGKEYYVTQVGNKVSPGLLVLSRDQIEVVCSNRKSDVEFAEEIIECSDGRWNRNISDIFCVKEQPFCPSIINAQWTGTFEDGFKVICSDGYEFEAQNEAVERFTISLEGVWEPFNPKCIPASCLIPEQNNADSSYIHENGDVVVGGSKVSHGSQVTLKCPRRHVPGDISFSCRLGKFDIMVPQCTFEQPFCSVIMNAHSTGTLEDGLEFTCSEGYEFEVQNEAKERFTCSLEGVWEPFTPKCIPASCLIPDQNNIDSRYIHENGDVVVGGSKVSHGSQVTLQCPRSHVSFSCHFGKFDIVVPQCTHEHPFCPMIINAQCAGSFEDGFQVICLEGYEFEVQNEAVESFTCSWEGVWEPFTPKCIPASCLIPKQDHIDSSYMYENGDEVVGTKVSHGSQVTLQCPRGHVPDDISFSCRFGKFDIEVPQCTFVTCPDPTVEKAVYKPKQDIYQYGDSVLVGGCPGLLAFVGSKQLECLQDGTWSDKALCEPFCEDGVVTFDDLQHTEFKEGLYYERFGLRSYASCKRKCLRFKKYLCRSFEYGKKDGKRYCLIRPQHPEEMPDLTQKRLFWTIGVRKCNRN